MCLETEGKGIMRGLEKKRRNMHAHVILNFLKAFRENNNNTPICKSVKIKVYNSNFYNERHEYALSISLSLSHSLFLSSIYMLL